jgi:hypothetical protein
MKIFNLLFLALCLGFSINTNAQDVKIKKGLVTIDGVPFISWENKGRFSNSTFVVQSEPQGIPLFSLKKLIVAVPNPHYEKNKKLSSTKTLQYLTIRFLDFEGAFTSKLSIKKLVREMHKMGVLDSEGKINEENARKFIEIYHEEINM